MSRGLTARQLEVARLVADDLTNREIAERLDVSIETVKQHVSEAMARAGVSRREELGDWYHRERRGGLGGRRLRGLLGVPLLLGASAVGVAAVVIVVAVGVTLTRDDAPSNDPSVLVSRDVPIATPTVAPTATPRPTVDPDSRNLSLDHEPKPWVRSAPEVTPFPTRIPPASPEEALEDAAVWLERYPGYEGELPLEFAWASGSGDYSCVVAVADELTRSGDFVLDLEGWDRPGAEVKLLPANAQSIGNLMIRGSQGRELNHVHEREGFAPDDRGWLPFPLAFPTRGEWLTVVTSSAPDPQWGCFLVTARFAEPITRSIAAAEAAGERHPSSPTPPPTPRRFRPETHEDRPGHTFGGTSDRECVDAALLSEVRSGEWLITWALYRQQWRRDGAGTKTLVMPLHQPSSREEARTGDYDARMRMRSASLDRPGFTYVSEAAGFRAFVPNPGGVGDYNHFPPILHPIGGDWLMTVEGAQDWGCFLISLVR